MKVGDDGDESNYIPNSEWTLVKLHAKRNVVKVHIFIFMLIYTVHIYCTVYRFIYRLYMLYILYSIFVLLGYFHTKYCELQFCIYVSIYKQHFYIFVYLIIVILHLLLLLYNIPLKLSLIERR